MKPYGNSRADNRTCDWGCCTYGSIRTRHRPVVRQKIRRARKSARQRARREIDRSAD